MKKLLLILAGFSIVGCSSPNLSNPKIALDYDQVESANFESVSFIPKDGLITSIQQSTDKTKIVFGKDVPEAMAIYAVNNGSKEVLQRWLISKEPATYLINGTPSQLLIYIPQGKNNAKTQLGITINPKPITGFVVNDSQ